METKDTKPDAENIRALHSALVSKRTTLDQLLWQAPVISLTAQAFLLTIAFDVDKRPFYRVASGVVATIIGLISWQLFLRHAALEKQASIDLKQLETKYFGETVHNRPEGFKGVANWKSRPIWSAGLFLTSLAGLLPLFEFICKMAHR